MILRGRGIARGEGKGTVLLSDSPISFLGGVDPADGRLSDPSMVGRSVKDRVFAFPRGKGSTVGSYVLLEMKRRGTLPAALINTAAEPIVATGAVMAGVPLVDQIDLGLLRDGDVALVDGKQGTVDLPEVEEKHVVSCVVQDGDRFLLLKRSEKVGTFQGHWAAVSGYVEPGEEPHQTAVKELREETGLSGMKAVKQGAPIQVRGENTVWVVHPFLFRARSPAIEIDWEHTEYRWVARNELKAFQTVPGLERLVRDLGL